MKRYKLNTLLAAAFVSAGFLTACNNEPLTYENGSGATGNDVYFSSAAKTQFQLDGEGGEFTVTINRGPEGQALTVPISVAYVDDSGETEAPENVFSFPSTVTFAEGSQTADFTVSYVSFEESGLDYDEYVGYLLTIAPEFQSLYGDSTLEINMTYPSPWTSLGKATYIDDAWWISEDATTIQVELQQNDLDKNLFRVANPYIAWTGEDTWFQFRLLQEGEVYLGQTVPTKGLVAYPDFKIDYDAEYDDDVYLLFPGRYPNTADPSNWVYNYVAEYQDNGLPGQIFISPWYYMFNTGGYNYTKDKPIQIIFPGFSPIDYSLSVTYNGVLTKPDGSYGALSAVDLGKDLAEAKVALVAGDDVAAAVAGIEDGSIKSQSLSSSSELTLAFDPSDGAGQYSIVAIGYADGEAVAYDYATFKFSTSAPETWSLVSAGTYTYLSFWEENLGIEPEVLELYQNDSDPTHFKIEHWFNDVNFEFTMDASGNIMVADQPTGLVNGGDGMIYVTDLVDYTGTTENGQSFLEDGEYNFAVIYYVSKGYFDYGYETFVPSTAAQSKAKKISKATRLRKTPDIKTQHNRIVNSVLRHTLSGRAIVNRK